MTQGAIDHESHWCSRQTLGLLPGWMRHLVRSADEVQVVFLQELHNGVRPKRVRHPSVVLAPPLQVCGQLRALKALRSRRRMQAGVVREQKLHTDVIRGSRLEHHCIDDANVAHAVHGLCKPCCQL